MLVTVTFRRLGASGYFWAVRDGQQVRLRSAYGVPPPVAAELRKAIADTPTGTLRHHGYRFHWTPQEETEPALV